MWTHLSEYTYRAIRSAMQHAGRGVQCQSMRVRYHRYAIPLRTECGSRSGGPRRPRSVGVAQVRAHPLLDLLDGHALALGVVGDLVLA